ncbi:MAG TPA: TolC family protein [Nitrospiria bacterium]
MMKSSISLFTITLLIVAGIPAPIRAQGSRFDSMTLEQARRLALERNLGIKSSEADLEGARAEMEGRYAGFFPKLSAEGRYSLIGEVPRIEIGAGAFSPAPPLPPSDTLVRTGERANYTLRLSLEQPLFTGGAIYYAYRSARLGYASADLLHRQTVQDLLLRVELAYWDILKTEGLRDVAGLQVSDLKEHLRSVKATYDAGSVPYNEVLKTAVSLAEAEQHFLSARNTADLARMAMNNLLRQDLTSAFRPGAPSESGPFDLLSYEEASKTAAARRIDLQRAHTQVETMQARKDLARSGYYPSISAAASYERARETAVVLPENWEVMGVLRWTFWDWGRTGSEVSQAESRVRRSEQDLQALTEAVALELREHHLRAQEAREKIAVTRGAVEQARENFRITEERFKAGMTTNTEVLDAESLLASARANQTNAIYDFFSARARLNRAMGIMH